MDTHINQEGVADGLDGFWAVHTHTKERHTSIDPRISMVQILCVKLKWFTI